LEAHLDTLITLLTSGLDCILERRVNTKISETFTFHKSARRRRDVSLNRRIDSGDGVRRFFISQTIFDIESSVSGNERQYDTGIDLQGRIETVLERLVTRRTSFCSREVGSGRFCGR